MNAHEGTVTLVEPEIDQASRAIVVDVTAVSGQAFFTGIQRMVREFCEAHPRDILLVKFDAKGRVFRVVPRLTRLRYRSVTGWRGRLRVWLKNLYWNASKEFREEGSRRRWIPAFARRWARRFYERFLSDTQLEREGAFHRRPVWQPLSTQSFFLIDLPVSMPHIVTLANLVESHDVKSVIYLHDLFPLSHKNLFDSEHHASVRARHLRYLDIVSAADEVVCNSAFTKSQYERFVALMQDPPRQDVRVVYPPWPQFSARRAESSTPVEGAFSDAGTRILAVGGLSKRKNLAVLLPALARLHSLGVSASLVIVAGDSMTDPEFRAELLGLPARVRDRVQVFKQVSDDRLVSLYDQSTVVAVPSLAEGFGLPVVEGLGRSRPVVAANTTALPELADILPITLVDPHDASAWADALQVASDAGIRQPIARPSAFPEDWTDFRSRIFET